MPFVKKTDLQGSQPPTDLRKIFIGREGELLFFRQNILKPEDPTHNIISISGQGGVGKSTLLSRFIDEAHSSSFKDYCLTAFVDERRTTPIDMMEKFAEQLHLSGVFEKALKRYKEMLCSQETEQETLQETLWRRVPDFAGAAVEGIPFAGPILREATKATTAHLLSEHHTNRLRKNVEQLEDPIDDLTKAFVTELNPLADTKITLSSHKTRQLRVMLFFDTFEQLAIEAVPWLLGYFLEAEISKNVVLVIAGRDPIEHSTPESPKRWLPLFDNETIYSISLSSFTEDETRNYLVQRGIADPERIATIWQLSRGLPLYLSLLTSNPQGEVDPTKDVVDNFLRWIPEHEQVKRRLALDAALLSKPFNQDDLEAFTYLPKHGRLDLYYWLTGLSFVHSQEGRFRYHELAQDLFSRHLYQRSRKEYYSTRRDLADYYQPLLEEIQIERGKETYQLSEWLELTLALAYQLFSLVDEASHIKAIEQVLNAYQYTDSERNGEIAKFLRELSEKQSGVHISTSAQQAARQLLQYIEADVRGQERMAAATTLIERVTGVQSFSTVLLAHLYNHRGWAYLHLKEYQQAIHDFDRAIELHPEDAWTYGSRGLTYHLLKEYQQAIANFDHALELNPQYTWVYGSRGLTYRLLQNFQQAIADFDRALELNPQYAWAYGSRGLTYRLLKEYQRAIADFSRAIELNSQYAWAYGSRGLIYYLLREYQQAIADFDRALELNPQYAWAYGQRGRVYKNLKEYQQATADFDHAIKFDAKFTMAYIQRGITYMILKESQQALSNFDYALQLDPRNASIFAQRGMTYLWMGNINQATIDYVRSWEIDMNYIGYGWMAEWSRMCQEIFDLKFTERLEAIAVVDPQHYLAYVCRGVALWRRKCFVESLTELEQAISLDPEKWDSYFWKGMVFASLEQDEEAMAMIEKSLELELPPVLLAPLRCLEKDRPDFYQKFVVPLFARYELTG